MNSRLGMLAALLGAVIIGTPPSVHIEKKKTGGMAAERLSRNSAKKAKRKAEKLARRKNRK